MNAAVLGAATLFIIASFLSGSTLQEKNLLLQEQIHVLIVDPILKEFFVVRNNQKVSKVDSLGKNGRKI